MSLILVCPAKKVRSKTVFKTVFFVKRDFSDNFKLPPVGFS